MFFSADVIAKNLEVSQIFFLNISSYPRSFTYWYGDALYSDSHFGNN